MSAIDELLARNRRIAGGAPAGRRSPLPARELAIVTCMDCRLDALAALGLELGEAHVLRNAGGAVTDDVIRSLAISQRRLGTRAVMLVHHTDCGMGKLDEEEFRAELEAEAGGAPPFAIESFDDLDAAVREAVLRVRRSPFLPHRDQVRGFVCDVESQALREVEVEPGPDRYP
jgi:carbonic anhydrase